MASFYRGYDDLPQAAREVIRNSAWLGMLQEWQIRQIPRSSNIAERLRQADAAMKCGNNVAARFTEPMMTRLRALLFTAPGRR